VQNGLNWNLSFAGLITVTDVELIKQKRLKVGDVLQDRKDSRNGSSWEYRMKLLWVGKEIAVWSHQNRQVGKDWSQPEEKAHKYLLKYHDWQKATKEQLDD
jgi:hypothetical protein